MGDEPTIRTVVRLRRGSKPLLAMGLVFGLLLLALSVGVRIPILGRFPLGRGASSLDYSQAPYGNFAPLKDDYIKGILGRLISHQGHSRSVDQQRLEPNDRTPPRPPPPPPLSNDHYEHAAGIASIPYSTNTNTAGASRQEGEPAGCGTVKAGTVWFRYVARQDDSLIAHTFGSGYATALTVYEGSRLTALREVGRCNEDLQGNAHVSFRAVARRTYFFQVAAALLDGGVLRFALEQDGVTTAASLAASGDTGGNNNNYFPSISGDGRYVAFASGATNLVDGLDEDAYPCPTVRVEFCTSIFRHDRLTRKTQLVSVDPSGRMAGNDWSITPLISADGRYVAFTSSATNLLPGEYPRCVR